MDQERDALVQQASLVYQEVLGLQDLQVAEDLQVSLVQQVYEDLQAHLECLEVAKGVKEKVVESLVLLV